MKKANRLHLLLLFIAIAVLIWSAISPASYKTWIMEVLPGFIILLVAVFTYRKWQLTTLSYVIITFLVILTFIGGHYIYSEVPLFNKLKNVFDWERNHYDRFGHLLKGLFVIVIREILLMATPLKKGVWLNSIVLSIMLAIAALYEIVEWLASKITHGGKAARDFLGTQGDIWDTQWDMSFTLIGSLVGLMLLLKLHDRLLDKKPLDCN